MTETTSTLPGRSLRKRQTILSAGRALFLSNGYQGTSIDQIAASAEVSKQTVYKHFGDKQELLFAIVTNALDSTVTPFVDRIAALAQTTDLETDLTALARDYLRAVLGNRSCSCAAWWSAKPTGYPRWRSCTTTARRPARWPRSPTASAGCMSAVYCMSPNPLCRTAFRVSDRR